MRGKMKWFNEEKDHGYIETEEGERLLIPGTGFAEMMTVSPGSTVKAGWSPYAIRVSADIGSPWLPVHSASTW